MTQVQLHGTALLDEFLKASPFKHAVYVESGKDGVHNYLQRLTTWLGNRHMRHGRDYTIVSTQDGWGFKFKNQRMAVLFKMSL